MIYKADKMVIFLKNAFLRPKFRFFKKKIRFFPNSEKMTNVIENAAYRRVNFPKNAFLAHLERGKYSSCFGVPETTDSRVHIRSSMNV